MVTLQHLDLLHQAKVQNGAGRRKQGLLHQVADRKMLKCTRACRRVYVIGLNDSYSVTL